MPHSDLSFGQWVRRQRKSLRLTQEALGLKVVCSPHTIRKIEAGERHPSRRLTARLAAQLLIAAADQARFCAAARGVNGSLFAGEHEFAGAAGDTDVSGRSYAPRPFVGRERECRALRAHLARLPSHHGRTVLVEGEAGIGKTRLVQEACLDARRAGLPVAHSKCHEIERDVAYHALVDLIEQALALAPVGFEQRLDSVARAELALLVPALAARGQAMPTLSAELPQARQARLFTAVHSLFQALAEPSGLLLVLDDLQWLDDASALALVHLARHAQSTRVLLLLACRSEDLNADPRLARILAELQAGGRLERLPLPEFTRAEVAELLRPAWVPPQDSAAVQARGGSTPGGWLGQGLHGPLHHNGTASPEAAQAEWLSRWHAWCRGNPLFLVAAMDEGLLSGGNLPANGTHEPGGLQAVPDPLPAQVQGVVGGRLARMSAAALRLVEATAAIGRGAGFELMQAVAADQVAAPHADWLDALEELLRRRWLTEDDASDGYNFLHDRLRDAVLAEMSAARRTLLHASVARHLAQGDAVPHALIAEHEEHARRWADAVRHRLLAGQEAEAVFAVQEAIGHYTHGLHLAERHAAAMPPLLASELLERRGLAHAWLSQVDQAAADLQPAVTHALARLHAGRAVELLIALGMSYQRADRYAPGAEVLHQALQLAHELNDHKSAAVAMWWLGDIDWALDDNAAASGWFEKVMALNEAAGLDDEVRIKAHHGLGEVAVLDARPAEGLAQFWQSLAIAQRAGDTRMVCENLIVIAWAHLGAHGTGRYEDAIEHSNQVSVLAEEADMHWYHAPALTCKAAALAAQGRFGDALACFGPALAVAREMGMARFEAMALTWLAECCLEAEQPALALAHAEHARRLMDERGVFFFSHLLRAVHAQALIRLGRLDEVPDLDAALAVARKRRLGHAVLRTLETLTEWHHVRGDAAEAHACAQEWASLAAAHGVPEALCRAHAWTARLHADDGQHVAVLKQAERLLAELAPTPRFGLRLALHREARRCARAIEDDAATVRHVAEVARLEATLADAAPLLAAFAETARGA